MRNLELVDTVIALTKDDYFTVSGTGHTWACHFDPFPKQYKNLFVESQQAAEEIYSRRQGEVYILYSGGIDSEFCLSVFLSLGMKVTPVIIKLNPNYNNHDIEYAFKFCESKNITPLVIDIDFDKFVNSGQIVDYAKKYRSEKYHMSATMYGVGQLDGTIILGSSEPYVGKNQDTNKWHFEYCEYEWSISRFFEQNNIYGTPNFNCWTSGINASYLTDPMIFDLVNNNVYGKLGSHSSKHAVYNRHGNLNLTVRPKLHGYEIVEQSKIFEHEAFKEIEEFGKECNGVYQMDYFEFMKLLGWKKNV